MVYLLEFVGMYITVLTLLTDDISETDKFYTEILELEPSLRETKKLSYIAGSTILNFVKSDHCNPLYHFAFNIPNNKLEEAMHWIEKKTKVLNVSEIEKIVDSENWNAQNFYFRDNNGNILEFIARFDLNNTSGNVFNSSLILSVSEIGIAVDNVLKESKNFIARYGLNYFPKQTPYENFAAVGDDEGLIIFAEKGRHWFPTDHPAEKIRTKVKINYQGKNEVIIFHDETDSC